MKIFSSLFPSSMKKYLLLLLLFCILQSQKTSSSEIQRFQKEGFKVDPIIVDGVTFSPEVKPPAWEKTLFLSGAGIRGLEINRTFVKFTAIGVYLEDTAVQLLAVKWINKTAQQLNSSVEFFRDVVTGPFEKLTIVTTILPLMGPQYSEKVAENCVEILKSLGVYSEKEIKAVYKFLQVFKKENFPPGSSILFKHKPHGLEISFSNDGRIPEVENAVIKNKLLSEAILESIIGKNGVSPAARLSIASRLAVLFQQVD